MKLNRNLSPSATRAQRRSKTPFQLLAKHAASPVRIAPAAVVTHPVLRGEKSYLRALRAAEMAAWTTSIRLPE